ncbi:hypothetical protein HOLleu_35796 [Holothuria leucospilota]|uniref:Uncharacterized protein n=1 Tax=Holothuria leucospilota TaxID=206669 RepID=A0A9Q1BG47_HOLLE|nr:hypothetical protein HOLleu_35796 [Holothuria leucospilota]
MTEICYSSCTGNRLPIVEYTDNKSLHQNIHSTKQVHEKCLQINIAEIQRMLSFEDIQAIEWIPSKLQVAVSPKE